MSKIKYILTLLFITISFYATAQKEQILEEDYSNNKIEMADVMRSEGKIYVLVAIIVTLFAGFVIYTIRTEQKIKKIEKSLKNKL
ncbi:hypothetical protein GCM10011506_43780 [Marivirga lumbricoides]|uniref:CcmD family protein n=1 Tax=Marivirga lumbricoides TaxID=1046115 RepID=A0ABQ1N422_9BACT|nr:hypothetical protein GCM10011506_43780 [Marivirga lumbricoides]